MGRSIALVPIMNNGKNTILSLVAAKNSKIDFKNLQDKKSVDYVAKNSPLTEEQVEISREIVERFCNGAERQVVETIQGSGKSKGVCVAINYLIDRNNAANFAYFSHTHENKLSETFEDLTQKDRIIDPFTAEEIVVEDKAEVFYLKGLDRFIEERREELGIPENQPLGIYEKSDGSPTILKKLHKDQGLPLNLVLSALGNQIPDYEDILEDWNQENVLAKRAAENKNQALVTVAPKELREKDLFQENEFKQFLDEADYNDTQLVELKFDRGLIAEWIDKEVGDDETSDILKKNMAQFAEKICLPVLQELEEFSLNNKPERKIKQLKPEERILRAKDRDGNLYCSQSIDLFESPEAIWGGKGLESEQVRSNLNRYFQYEIVEDEIKRLIEDGRITEARKIYSFKQYAQKIFTFLDYGTFLCEKHAYNQGVNPGKNPFGEHNECHLFTIKNGIDDIFERVFLRNENISVLSASLEEDWFDSKLKRFKNNFDLDFEPFYNFETIEKDMEVNISIRPVKRMHKKSRAASGSKDIYYEYDKFFQRRINENPDREAVSPLDMNTGSLSWASNVLGSNEGEGAVDLFLFFTYSPPSSELVKVYADMTGEFPPLEFDDDEDGFWHSGWLSSDIPEEYVQKTGYERSGYKLKELDMAHKCLVSSHINDAIYRMREHYDSKKTVYLIGLTTEHIEEEFDGVVLEEWRMDDLVSYLIVDDERKQMEQFEGEPFREFTDWIEKNHYNFDQINSKVLARKIGRKMGWSIKEGVIQLPHEKKVFQNISKNEWVKWKEEFIERKGDDLAPDTVDKTLPDNEGDFEYGGGYVEVKIEKEKQGVAPQLVKYYKFYEAENN